MKNIIIGAGPAGLQLGYFFQKEGIEYVILEKNAIAASFFNTYPHSGKLISINKKNTGHSNPDFNMRHDWNSLLADDTVRFTQYSDDYYPDKDDLVKYLNEYAVRHSLNIQYNTTVNKILKEENGYTLETSAGILLCEKLIVATGISKPITPYLNKDPSIKIKHYSEYEKDYFKKKENLELFKGKSLFIFGNGNSAYELSNLLTPYCSSIVIHGRRVKKWAMISHYVGDIRSVYMPYHDTFLLKSQNGIMDGPGGYLVKQNEKLQYEIKVNNINVTSLPVYDHVIFCSGWRFDTSIFDFKIPLIVDKYPVIKTNYESVAHKDLYFIGSLMHYFDFKRGSGGFIHGFRYLIKFFFQRNYLQKFDQESLDLTELINTVCDRINTSSSLYQLYAQLADIFYYDISSEKFIYIKDITIKFFLENEFKKLNDIFYFIVSLEYGEEVKEVSKVGGKGRTDRGYEVNSVLLHPVLKVYKNNILVDEIHFDEDLLADFTDPLRYRDKLVRSIKMFI